MRIFTLKHNIAFFALLYCGVVCSQDSISTHIDYDLSTEVNVGNGEHSAFYVATNRYHALSVRTNTGYIRGAVSLEHNLPHSLSLTGVVDVIASVHADHGFYLQQCYVNLRNKAFFAEIGSREQEAAVRHKLSSGSFIKGTNAKPIPQIHVGTNGFWTVPYTKNWLQINFDFGYGKTLDDKYKRELFENHPTVNSFYTDNIYYHQKHLYFQSNPQKKLFGMIGIEHAVFFGGDNYMRWGNTIEKTSKPHNLKAFWNVILPLGDSDYFENNTMEDWVYGNHLGVMTYQLGWNINQHHTIKCYLDNPFEDGSGIRKGNGYDGLWGIEYNNKTTGRQYIRSAVFEYFQTTNQSGPIHWDRNDYPAPVRNQITSIVTGNDNYYNHAFFGPYAYYGMSLGNALIPSPVYNDDMYAMYYDNRVQAWHLGVDGEISDHLSYVVKGGYREGKGTYNAPLERKHHSFDLMLQCAYNWHNWQYSCAYALDRGNIYGDCNSFNIKIKYHGKIY